MVKPQNLLSNLNNRPDSFLPEIISNAVFATFSVDLRMLYEPCCSIELLSFCLKLNSNAAKANGLLFLYYLPIKDKSVFVGLLVSPLHV